MPETSDCQQGLGKLYSVVSKNDIEKADTDNDLWKHRFHRQTSSEMPFLSTHLYSALAWAHIYRWTHNPPELNHGFLQIRNLENNPPSH